MAKIVGIGACVMDTLITLPHYPKEDTKLRAESVKTAGGGPTATGIVAASKLGIDTAYIGVLSNDNGGVFLKDDFEKYGVDTSLINIETDCRSFTSAIWLSRESTSRTCVFDRGTCPKLVLSDAQKKAIADADVLMVDGNELSAAIEGARVAKDNGTSVLYDAGGLYEGIEPLLALTDILIPSEEFALAHTGEATAEKAGEKLLKMYSPRVVVITQGKMGGILFDGNNAVHYPIYPAEVVDSNGSGDVFHGAFAAAAVRGFGYEKCCHFSSAVSALKCMGVGARESVPSYETTVKYLKENGYEL